MKYDKIIWGVLLLFVGGVLLLQNFDIIDFYWRSIWAFWPLLLIIFGLNLLLNKNNSQLGSQVSLGIMVVALVFLFVKGQQKPERDFWSFGNHSRFDDNADGDDDDDDAPVKTVMLFETFNPDSVKNVDLVIKGKGAAYEIKGGTDSLFTALVKGRKSNYLLKKMIEDSTATLSFQLGDDKHKNWNFDSDGNSVDLFINKRPEYKLDINLGAGKIDFDLQSYKVREINFNGGAAEVDLKIGDLLPITDVNVQTGIADINIKVPSGSGCRIHTKTGLSSKDFSGFTKVSDGVYETANYKTATKKVFLNFDGGLSSFEVERY